jgi:ubiquinone biosynthesis protein
MGTGALILDFIARFFEVTTTVFYYLGRIIYRKLTKRPVEGPLLVRELCERLSGSFVKFGQVLSLQIDQLPKEYCDALLSLLDRVPPFPGEQVDTIFEGEFHKLPTEVFQNFDYQALASASIGQVHTAFLQDGTKVAVKVQRPDIGPKFVRDTQLLELMVRVILFLHISRLYFMRDAVRELATWTKDELDYRREAAYCKMLGENAIGNPTERVPKVYSEFSSARVLTMEFLVGPSVSSYLRMLENRDEAGMAALRAQGFVPSIFSSNVISNFLSDAFRHGVFHADLHPANLLILPNNVVGYVDFGIVAILTPEARRKQVELTMAYASGEAEEIYQGFLNICIVTPDADLVGMRRRIYELCRQWYHEAAVGGKVRFRVTVTQAMSDLLNICQRYGVLVDREMIKYIRSTVLADGLVSRIAPEVDLARILRDVVEDYLAEESRRRIISKGHALELLTDLALWLESGPRGFLHAMNRFERGDLRVLAGIERPANPSGRLRARAIYTAAVLAVLIGTLIFEGSQIYVRSQYLIVFASIVAVILTLRLLRLLRRLVVE